MPRTSWAAPGPPTSGRAVIAVVANGRLQATRVIGAEPAGGERV